MIIKILTVEKTTDNKDVYFDYDMEDYVYGVAENRINHDIIVLGAPGAVGKTITFDKPFRPKEYLRPFDIARIVRRNIDQVKNFDLTKLRSVDWDYIEFTHPNLRHEVFNKELKITQF